MKSEIGLIGLGVMGRSLSRNLARNGFKLSIYNRHVAHQEENVAAQAKSNYAELSQSQAFDDLEAFVGSIAQPRKIILMVNAGPTVDVVLEDLQGLLAEGDIVIDGGNSHFEDTERRITELKKRGLHFIGTGVSGGEQGALMGPSIMPSGEKKAYDIVGPYLEAIAAKDDHGLPCCTYVGAQGAGHFVKMIHNGIEYAEMQLIAECYSILKSQGLSNPEISSEFSSWMQHSASYLLEISADILLKKDGEGYLIDSILDKAGNKGTGKWTTVTIADFGEPATMIPAALFARYLSFFKEKREAAAHTFGTADAKNTLSKEAIKEAYQFARIVNHHQGFSLIARVSDQHDWRIDLSGLARIWTGGCIIKSDFMKDVVEILKKKNSLLADQKIQDILKRTHSSAQLVAATCIKNELHIPCLLEATNFFHGLKTAQSSANMIQAQRDYFGAHTYERIDDSSGTKHHTEW